MPLIASMQNNSRLELKPYEIRKVPVRRHVRLNKEPTKFREITPTENKINQQCLNAKLVGSSHESSTLRPLYLKTFHPILNKLPSRSNKETSKLGKNNYSERIN